MNDSSGKASSSSLAITEKRPQRSGGCIGSIFFQLFDWNRRLAKKKLFSKKLLPPARAKRASQKFGDEKLPKAKLLLIDDENRGGFPKKSEHDNVDSSANAERVHEMKSPGLVARLMGLESMPAVRRSKPKKLASTFDYNPHQEKESEIDHNVDDTEITGCNQEEYQFEKGGHLKMESRPQKLQKTGLFERRPVTRFGSEALQFKGVLSRSRKHQHPKLASPVKSPRRNSTRLMDAATKILEPGLQATQRAKCSLSYTPSVSLPHKNEGMRGGEFVGHDQSEPSRNYASVSKSMKGQPSCKSCGNWLDVVDRRVNVEERGLRAPGDASSSSDFGIVHPPGSGRSKMKSNVSSLEQERNVVAPIRQERFVSFRSESRDSIQKRSKKFSERKPEFRENQHQYRLSSQRTKSHKDVASVTTLKQRTPKQSQTPLAKDRGTLSPKYGNLNCQRDLFNVGFVDGAKDFAASNRNSTNKTRTRLPPKVLDNSRNDIERNVWEKRDDSPSRLRASVRKRRPTNGAAQGENTKFNQPTLRKQRDVGGDAIVGKVVGSSAYFKNQNHAKTEITSEKLPRESKRDAAGASKDVDVISFTFSSPMTHNTESTSPAVLKTGGRSEFMDGGGSMNRKLISNSFSGDPSSHMAKQSKADALGAFLEEKLRELTNQDRDELETGDLRGRSTASILEELIHAFTVERPSSQEAGDNCSVGFSQEESVCYVNQNPPNDISSHHHMSNANKKLQGQAKAPGALFGYPRAGDAEQPSPGSVLEASFSVDSYFSESLDGCSGCKAQPESMECSYDEQQPPDLDADLSDSATSMSTGRDRIDNMTYSLNNISSVLYGIDPAEIGLVGSELNHAWEVIVNAELLLGSLCGVHGLVNFSIGSLLDKMETLTDALWSSRRCSMGFTEDKSGLQLRRFLFDCLIEYLDSKYGDYCRFRFSAWPQLPLQINGDLLVQEVHDDVQRWVDLAGKMADEIIDRELTQSSGKWTDFEIEAFESCVEIESDILQVLVDEVVIDLGQCRSLISH